MNKDSITESNLSSNNGWKPFYKASGIMTIIMLVVIPLQVVILAVTSMPSDTEGWLRLFRDNWLLGLVHMDALYIIDNVILLFVYMSLALSMFRYSPALMTSAFMLGAAGIITLFTSNKAVDMFFLSREYYTVADEAARSLLLASAKNMLIEWNGTAYVIYYYLNAAALLLISIVMYKSRLFGKAATILGFISTFFMLIPANFGLIGMAFALISLIPWYGFSIFMARAFLRFGRKEEETPPIGFVRG